MSDPTVDLAWEAEGPAGAPAVVFGHSLGADRSAWEPQARALGAAYRVVRVDLRAHGASPAPPGPYTLEQLAADVLRAADAAGVERFHYCGVSLGGMVGLWLAAHRPERIAALVAADTASKIGTAERWRERIRAVDAGGLAAIADAVVGSWFRPGFAADDPARLEHVRQVFARTDPAGYAACCAALAEADVTPDLASIRAPTLIVVGRLDRSTPVADAEALRAGIRGSALVVLDDAAHLSNLDQSEAFTRHVAELLRSHGAGGGRIC